MNRVLGLVLFLGTVAVFWPLGEAGFVNYDDPGYVYENPHVVAGLRPEGVRWAFTTFHKANYHPVTWLSHMIDVQLFGVEPGPHHLVSVFLHALNAVLLFAFLVRGTAAPGPSLFAAALFALHPLHVESVAWISERKDVLSTFFWLLAMHAYLTWVRLGGALRYAGVLVVLGLALLAKPVAVTLPCVLFLLDIWPLRRLGPSQSARLHGEAESVAGLIYEKLPMFALVAVASWATLAAQTAGGAVIDSRVLPWAPRVANALVAYVWYLEKLVWPSGLAVLYPHPYLATGGVPGLGVWIGPLLVLALVTGVVGLQVKDRPYLLVGWLWFLGTLVPMIGVVQVGAQATADRYTYVPLIGPFFALAFLGTELAARSVRWKRWCVVGAVGVLLVCATVTRAQLSHWEGARALAARSVAVTPANYVMHFNLGLALEAEGDLVGARRHYERAIEIESGRGGFHGNLATVLVQLDEPAAAVERYRIAVRIEPGDPSHANNLAWLLATHPDPAVRDGAEALRLAKQALAQKGRPEPEILDTLAAAQAELGRFAIAVSTAERAVDEARRRGNEALAATVAGRARTYARGRPYREGVAGSP